jgi:Leucine-rich repeat (LRR) protein
MSKIPDAIAELKNLTELFLSYNQISKIPDAIAELKNLTGLFLSGNQISEIPDAITGLKNLNVLDLSGNLIREIPAEIIHLENLERDQDGSIEGIDIQGNPIINPPYEIAAKGIYAIRSYFLSQQNQQLSRYKDDDTMIKITSNREKIFVSYSHKDSKWLKEFQTHIKPFVRADGFEIWDDTKIKSGSEWLEEIEKALTSAKVAVLLVSPNFIASDFIHNKELPPLFDAAEKEGLTIFWIPIRHSAYAATKIEKYQSAHPPDKPIYSLNPSKKDEAWVNLCKKIAKKMTQTD